jgi:hypothetical protein
MRPGLPVHPGVLYTAGEAIDNFIPGCCAGEDELGEYVESWCTEEPEEGSEDEGECIVDDTV